MIASASSPVFLAASSAPRIGNSAAGLKQGYPGRYAPEVLVKLVIDEKVTLSHCVPTILQMILNSPAAQGRTFPGWGVIIGGSALPKALCQEGLERGLNVYAVGSGAAPQTLRGRADARRGARLALNLPSSLVNRRASISATISCNRCAAGTARRAICGPDGRKLATGTRPIDEMGAEGTRWNGSTLSMRSPCTSNMSAG